MVPLDSAPKEWKPPQLGIGAKGKGSLCRGLIWLGPCPIIRQSFFDAIQRGVESEIGKMHLETP